MAALAKQPNSGYRRTSGDVDAEALASELRKRIRGEVRFDNGSRALYATDASNYRQIPIGVVCPRDASDVEETLAQEAVAWSREDVKHVVKVAEAA